MKKKLIAMLLLAGSSMFAASFSFGVSVGGPRYYAPAPVAVAYRPVAPGPGYIWVDGYYDGYRHWVNGYWALPPYSGAYWVAPRYYGGRFVAGYWGGPRFHEGYRFHGGYYRGFRR